MQVRFLKLWHFFIDSSPTRSTIPLVIEKNHRMPAKGFYTIREVAVYLAVSEKSVRRLVNRGLLKPSRALRKLLIPVSELEAFFSNTS